MEKKKRRYFPDEFKRQAAERVETSGLSIMDVDAELGVHETQLRCWIRQFGKSGTGALRRAPICRRRARPRPTWQQRMMSH
jgi:transposase